MSSSISSDSSSFTEESPKDEILVTIRPSEPEFPPNWSTPRKLFVVLIGLLSIVNGLFSTSLPANESDSLAEHFNVTDPNVLVLAITTYQIGNIVGALTFGPLSETYGRRYAVIIPSATFAIFTLASVYAPNWSAVLVFRFFRGISASSAISVIGGIFADIFNQPRTRGRANAVYFTLISIIPQFAPITSGYASRPPHDWRWPTWIAFIMSAVSLVPTLFLPETYLPILAQRRAKKRRSETGNPAYIAMIEKERRGFKDIMVIFMARPIHMIFTESIVLFTALYLLMTTGIYYLFFEAYPIVFEGVYGFSPGESGLTLLPVAAGAVLGFGIFLLWDAYQSNAHKKGKAWAEIEEYRRLPMACIAGPLCIISLFWLGWSSTASTSYYSPIFAGLPFGTGFYLILMSLNVYLTDSYKTFSASAIAAASSARSIGGAILPLAAKPMYDSLGVHWATSLLAFLMMGVAAVPFVFIRYGDWIRERSKFAGKMREEEDGVEEEGGECDVESVRCEK